MLTLAHGCACDVCAEEYGAQRLPHSIPCGHVLCASCCTAIIDKCSARQVPSCPFCRVQFSHDQIRLIRMDFTSSGWTTPRRLPADYPSAFEPSITSDLLARRTERLLQSGAGGAGSAAARRLEDKVAKVAAKKCSVEEVAALHKELEDWLLAEKDDQTSSLYLSAALLRAILMNHTAHSEASKAAKSTESQLRSRVHELEESRRSVEGEVARIHAQLTAKSHECHSLRQEISQLKALATTLGVKPDSLPPSTPHAQLPTPPSTSPTPYSSSQSSYSSSASASASAYATPLSPVSRFHSRSASSSVSSGSSSSSSSASRPQTPAATRSHTPAAPSMSASRSHTPGLASPTRPSTSASMSSSSSGYTSSSSSTSGRSSSASASAAAYRPSTPGHGLRTYTPAPTGSVPAVPPVPTRYTSASTPSSPMRSHTSHGHHASYSSSPSSGTYAPAPLVPPKPRRLSTSVGAPPVKIGRTLSEEKADAHERWIPPTMSTSPPDSYFASARKEEGYGGRDVVDDRRTPRPSSRMAGGGFMGFSSAAHAATRLKDLNARG